MDITDLVQMLSDHRQFLLFRFRYLPQNQTFPRIVQNRHIRMPHLFQNPMRQSAETQNVNIHNTLVRMLQNQIHLRLHRELIRYDQKEIAFRFPKRCLDHIFMKFSAFAGSRTAEVKLQCHASVSSNYSFPLFLIVAPVLPSPGPGYLLPAYPAYEEYTVGFR